MTWLGRILRGIGIFVVTLLLGEFQSYYDFTVWPVAVASGLLAFGGKLLLPLGLVAPAVFLAFNIVPPGLLKVLAGIVQSAG